MAKSHDDSMRDQGCSCIDLGGGIARAKALRETLNKPEVAR